MMPVGFGLYGLYGQDTVVIISFGEFCSCHPLSFFSERLPEILEPAGVIHFYTIQHLI